MVGVRVPVAFLCATVAGAFAIDSARAEPDSSVWFFKLIVLAIALIGIGARPIRAFHLGISAFGVYSVSLLLGEASFAVRLLEISVLAAAVMIASITTDSLAELSRSLSGAVGGRPIPLQLSDSSHLIQAEMKRARRTESPLSMIAIGLAPTRPRVRFPLLKGSRRSVRAPGDVVQGEVRATDRVLLAPGAVIVLCPDTPRAAAERLGDRIGVSLSDYGFEHNGVRPATFPADGLAFEDLLAQITQPVGIQLGRVISRQDAPARGAM